MYITRKHYSRQKARIVTILEPGVVKTKTQDNSEGKGGDDPEVNLHFAASSQQSLTSLCSFLLLCYINEASSPEDSRKTGTKTPQNGSWHHSFFFFLFPRHLMKPPSGFTYPTPCTKQLTLQGAAAKGKCQRRGR